MHRKDYLVLQRRLIVLMWLPDTPPFVFRICRKIAFSSVERPGELRCWPWASLEPVYSHPRVDDNKYEIQVCIMMHNIPKKKTQKAMLKTPQEHKTIQEEPRTKTSFKCRCHHRTSLRPPTTFPREIPIITRMWYICRNSNPI
jgi:hypothetical protein